MWKEKYRSTDNTKIGIKTGNPHRKIKRSQMTQKEHTETTDTIRHSGRSFLPRRDNVWEYTVKMVPCESFE